MTTPTHHDANDWLTKRTLEKLVRAELATAEHCRITIENLDDPIAARPLRGCFRSHLARARTFARELTLAGEVPPDVPGIRGTMGLLVQEAAVLVGDRMALANLDRVERRHTRRYRSAQRHLKSSPHAIVRWLAAEQRRVARAVHRVAQARD